MFFASDNWAGASSAVANKLTEAAVGFVPAYGVDDHSRVVTDWFSEVFEHEVAVFFVPTGTAANSLSLSSVMKPGGIVLCHGTSHIAVDEAGAPEFLSGGRLVTISGERGKITPDALEAAIRRYLPAAVHHGRPVAVSLTQATEWGTVYTVAEIQALTQIAHAHGLKVHMDGARFANALAYLNVQAADITWKAGVDVLSFGATKNGCWCAEAVVFFNHKKAEDFGYLRKRSGHLLSKSRFVAAQFEAYFDHGHWLDNAFHANAMAQRLHAGINMNQHARSLWDPEANEVFAVWSKGTTARLKAAGAEFYEWPADGLDPALAPKEGEDLVRLVTSFATAVHEVDHFLRALRK
ncbi:threonine aldolase family protein [Oryzibacter oryziterrae]|uniref:threonine aldolase family protein n=1 Tax=Oryzibacter oryziterrae TaxID=2766474 RepID=UPI001F438EDE|nr:low specificity L-threonine aldolase [Oryzibacter oryziterrae]